MPCKCDGYPEPTLAEQLQAREQGMASKYQELYECHQRVVRERDALLDENAKLRQNIIDREIG